MFPLSLYVSFCKDVKLVFETVKVALFKHDGITDGENATALDYGDALLKSGKISLQTYNIKQEEAKALMEIWNEATKIHL